MNKLIINKFVDKLLISGCKDEKMSILLKEVFQTPYFRVSYVTDEETVELCGALKVRISRVSLHEQK